MARPKSRSRAVHTAVRLPREMLDRLRVYTDGAHQRVSSEIRDRIQRTFDLEDMGVPDVVLDVTLHAVCGHRLSSGKAVENVISQEDCRLLTDHAVGVAVSAMRDCLSHSTVYNMAELKRIRANPRGRRWPLQWWEKEERTNETPPIETEER